MSASIALIAFVLVAAAACGSAPINTTELLEPRPGARIWPEPPETPRFEYVGTLAGEADFARFRAPREGIRKVLKMIAGLVVGEAIPLELRRPVDGLTDDNLSKVYVVDAGHMAIMVFDLPRGRLLKWDRAAPGIPFVSPVGIASDGRGGILVTDSELGQVFNLNARGDPIGQWGKGMLTRPTGIARDSRTGFVYVADSRANDIKVFDDEGVLVEIIGAEGKERGAFNTPTHLAVSDDRLYVADTLNFRIQVFDTIGNEQIVFGRLGLYVGNMTRPKGVAVGGGGRIYVVESYFDYLLVFDKSGQLLLPIGGTGRGVGQFFLPSGVWTDKSGRVYVADMFNGRVVILRELSGERAP